jgi:hypothetical protein
MAEKYQTCSKKSTKKFEVLGRRELAVSVPLPLVEVWEELQPGYVVFAGQKVPVNRPRVRTREGREVELASYRRLQHEGRRQRAVREGIVAGLTSRNYQRAVHSVLDGYNLAFLS